MKRKLAGLTVLNLVLLGTSALSQMTPWVQWTFLPPSQMDEIIGEASGEAATNHVTVMCGFPRDPAFPRFE